MSENALASCTIDHEFLENFPNGGRVWGVETSNRNVFVEDLFVQNGLFTMIFGQNEGKIGVSGSVPGVSGNSRGSRE